MIHAPKCDSTEYRLNIIHEFEDGVVFAKITCDKCEATTKARFRFIEVMQ